MKVIIPCGGFGQRFMEHTRTSCKQLVEIGPYPILEHLLRIFSCQGFNSFVLCLGRYGNDIKRHFQETDWKHNDGIISHGRYIPEKRDWQTRDRIDMRLVDTGEATLTAKRILLAKKWVETEETFIVTYSDGLADINLKKLVEFHKSHGKIATVTGVVKESNFGLMQEKSGLITSFSEKPEIQGFVNGGFFVFDKRFWKYLEKAGDAMLEDYPLNQLVKDGELMMYRHKGYWQCMDSFKDHQKLQNDWDSSKPWAVWLDKEKEDE